MAVPLDPFLYFTYTKTVTHLQSLEISIRYCTLIFLFSMMEISEASQPGINSSVEMVSDLGITSPILPYEGQDLGRQIKRQ